MCVCVPAGVCSGPDPLLWPLSRLPGAQAPGGGQGGGVLPGRGGGCWPHHHCCEGAFAACVYGSPFHLENCRGGGGVDVKC